MNKTDIEWCDETWNPVSGCSKVSQGCKNCYAERVFPRPYPGRKFTDVRCHPERLDQPLRMRKPRRIFVNSMSDLFHEDVPDEFIDRVFAVMADAMQHTFLVLTKRPERMREYLSPDNPRYTARRVFDLMRGGVGKFDPDMHWPLRNVWLGVSVEDQATADERIPLLLQTPAAVRFVSYEPALGPVDFERVLWPDKGGHRVDVLRGGYWNREGVIAFGPSAELGQPKGGFTNHGDMKDHLLNWVIIGGESGPGARPFDVQWARSVIAQCKAAAVPCFVKQLGRGGIHRSASHHFSSTTAFPMHTCLNCGSAENTTLDCSFVMRDRKGGDWNEWPEDLRVREFPT